MVKKDEEKEVRVFKPRNVLREKMGRGGIDPALIKEAQIWVETTEFDYKAIGADLIEKFETALGLLKERYVASQNEKNETPDLKDLLYDITAAIVEIKTSGTMFRYPLLSEAANISFIFVRNIKKITPDVFDVLVVHHRVLRALTLSKPNAIKDAKAEALLNELKQVSQRYFKKYNQ